MADAEHTWCAGLRVSRSRGLAIPELRRLRLRRRSALAKGWVCLSGVPIVLVACAAALAGPSTPRESFMATVALVLVMLGILLGVPVCIALANDYFRQAGALKRQRRHPEVLVCEGRVDEIVAHPSEMKRLLRRIGHGPEVALDVLMPSGLVWAIDGRPQESWIVVPRVRTAGAPEHARLAAQYVRPVQTQEGIFGLHQRPLSGEECSELRGYLPRVTLKGGLLALSLNAAGAGQAIIYGNDPTRVPLVGILVLAGAAWCDVQLVLAARRRGRMQKDLRDAFVVIYQPDLGVTASLESVVEFLPYSGIEWTRGGRAAPWRRLHGATPA
jgi:hypothetical protein